MFIFQQRFPDVVKAIQAAGIENFKLIQVNVMEQVQSKKALGGRRAYPVLYFYISGAHMGSTWRHCC